MVIFVKVSSDTRIKLNQLVKKYKKSNPLLRNSVTQDWIILKALNLLEAKK